MKTITKVALSAMTLVAVAAGSVAGTLAYLQSQTPVATNVMASGGVEIKQLELQRKEGVKHNVEATIGDLVPFEQNQVFAPAHPVVGATNPYTAEATDLFAWGPYVTGEGAANGLWNDNKLEGAIDKFVFVENTGDSACYYRTLIAFECPEDTEYSDNADKEFMMNVNLNHRFEWETAGYITVGGTRYLLEVVTYKEVLAAKEISRPSLLQVVMTHNATNEDVEKLDGEYEILVMSQACQTTNFDSADAALTEIFGAADTANATKWFSDSLGITTVSTADELAAALTKGGKVVLNNDVTVTSTTTIPAGVESELILNGNTLSYAVDNNGKAAAIINNKGILEISGAGTLTFAAADPDLQAIPKSATTTITNTGTLTINDGVTVENHSDGGASYAVDVQSGTFTLNGGTLKADRCALRIARFNADSSFEMNGGSVIGATPAWIHLPGSKPTDAPAINVVINDGVFQTTKPTSDENDVLYTYSFGNSHANTSITIKGGEFLGGTVSIGSGYEGDAPTLNILDGTFEYDVLQWLADESYDVLYEANMN